MTTRSGEDEETRTVLGALRQNPFTTTKMAEAHRNLYRSTILEMPTTHLYVKFMPASLKDMVLLDETDEFFYDFPLEYKVVEMGDYYQEIEEGSFPMLYAVVSPNFVFPDVPYVLLANLYLDESNPLLIAESFRITGNVGDIMTDILNVKGLKIGDLPPDVQAFIPEEPECPPGCTAVLEVNTNTIPISWIWRCDCEPPPPPPSNLNACGCEVYPNKRKPGGCVKVEDTELSTGGTPSTYRPVRRVKITVKNTWFTQDETWTNDLGCWKINKEYQGRMWMWVKFKNDRCRIRGAQANIKAAWQWGITIRDYVGAIWGPTFNDVAVNYNMYGNQGSNAHRYWGASTVNNALHEFHDYAGNDGIAPPPNDLDILVGNNDAHGYALMSAQDQLAQAAGAAAGYFSGPLAPLTALIGWAAVQSYLPDIHIGIAFGNSDRLKRLSYHELAHASHFIQAGPSFWENLVAAEILANGHGTATSFNAGLISLSESWAEHIGLDFAHRTYGSAASGSGTFQSREERRRNEEPNHIPIGFYHDLIDNVPDVLAACDENGGGCGVITDAASGFSNGQMFALLHPSTGSPLSFKNQLIQGATSTVQTQVNNLFNSY